MKIKKAIIPAAGLGTRVLPASKALPKEMLPIVDKPAIQYIVEEAVRAGITDILIITNRGKGVIEDHFDHSVELEAMLQRRGNTAMLETLDKVANLANIYYIRQKETRGLGDAVLRAKEFVGTEPFAVLYGDDVIIGEPPAIGELCEAYEKYGKSVVGIKEVSDDLIVKYSSLKAEKLDDKIYRDKLFRLGKLKYESKNADENPECINAVIIKNRHGERGTCALRWNGRFSRISDF